MEEWGKNSFQSSLLPISHFGFFALFLNMSFLLFWVGYSEDYGSLTFSTPNSSNRAAIFSRRGLPLSIIFLL